MSIDQTGRRDDTHDTQLSKLIETRLLDWADKPRRERPTITARKLKADLGLGDRPKIRMALYSQLEALQEEWGEPVRKIIWRVLKRSSAAREPGRWFAVVAIDELDRGGFLTRSR